MTAPADRHIGAASDDRLRLDPQPVKPLPPAARHLLECESLAGSVSDWGTVEPHPAFVARLKAEHGRRSAFWSLDA